MGKCLFMRKGETHSAPFHIPKGSTKLDHIESTGSQYLNLGFSPNQDTKIEIKFQTNQSSQCGIAVADVAWQSNGFGIWGNAACYGNETVQNLTLYGSEAITVILDKGKLYKNGELIWEASAATFQVPVNMTLMALNRNGTVQEKTSMKLWYFKAWDGDSLIRDCVPLMLEDGSVGEYDVVNGVFYGNAGSGTLTGSEVA